jgi:hypothetical protein
VAFPIRVHPWLNFASASTLQPFIASTILSLIILPSIILQSDQRQLALVGS